MDQQDRQKRVGRRPDATGKGLRINTASCDKDGGKLSRQNGQQGPIANYQTQRQGNAQMRPHRQQLAGADIQVHAQPVGEEKNREKGRHPQRGGEAIP